MDQHFQEFEKLRRSITNDISNIETEEDAKFRIINRILTEILGWKHNNIRLETKSENGFSDYIVYDGLNSCFLVEAKRIGLVEIRTTDTQHVRTLKLSGPALAGAKEGIEQAVKYASPNGINLACLTDGLSWVIFKTFIPNQKYSEKEAFTFPSLQSISNSFSVFYELLSKPSFEKKLFVIHFDQLHNNRTTHSNIFYTAFGDDQIKIAHKSALAFDLDRVFDVFFDRMKGDEDEDLLIECFVETRESRVADYSLEKMTAKILGNLAPVDNDIAIELSGLIEDAVDVDAGQTVFIVGPTGAGKTTFLDRFFRKTLNPSLRERCLDLRVNFLDSSGRRDNLLQWLTEQIILDIEKQIFPNQAPTYKELQGLYYTEYERRRVGVDEALYNKDKEAFKIKFGEFLDENVAKDRVGYLKRLLADVVHNRKKLPIIIIDNTDEFSIEYKQDIFQFCQSLRRHVKHCILIFPVTDKSAWTFSKTDLFGIYQSRSFFLPTPPPREVFRKRIDFIKQKMGNGLGPDISGKYFTQRGIKISIDHLGHFAKTLEHVFVNQDYTAQTIGEISNYNIRRTLNLSRRIITSSIFDIEDLIRSYTTGNGVSANYSKFMNALLKGDYDVYKKGDIPEIFPIFDVDKEIRQSPLIHLRALLLLKEASGAGTTIDDKHLTVQSIFDFFDTMGCFEAAVDRSLLALISAGLIEPYDASIRDLSPAQRLAITHSGLAHLRLALHNRVFFEQMALTAAINNQDTAEQIRSKFTTNLSFQEKMRDIREAFLEYLENEERHLIKIPDGSPQYNSQRELLTTLKRNFSKNGNTGADETESSLATEIKSGALAKVDFFDFNRGFGFVTCDGIDGQIFIHAEALREFKGEIGDGDDILCDIVRTERGPQVSIVHDIQTQSVIRERCKIVRIFAERNYGFASVLNLQGDAFFHFSAFKSFNIGNLHEGLEFDADVKTDEDGKMQIRRVSGVHE